MATIEDHIRCGYNHGLTLFNAVEADRGSISAQAFMAGLVQAAGHWNTARRGTVSTYELLNGLAEHAITPTVALRCLEAQLRAFVQKSSGEAA